MQKLLPDNTQQSQDRDILNLGRIRSCNPRNPATVGLHLRWRDQRDRPLQSLGAWNMVSVIFWKLSVHTRLSTQSLWPVCVQILCTVAFIGFC